MNSPLFEGVATALITPFTEDKSNVDLVAFERLVEYQLDNHTDALVVCGTTGESPVLSADEKTDLFRIAVKSADKKIPVIAGTGSNNTIQAVIKSNDAEKMGVDSLLIVTPFYNKCSQDGLIEHYFYIADRVSAPIIVYNVPSRTGVHIKPETYSELSKHKRIIAVKEASNDVSDIVESLSLCEEKLTFYGGNDDIMIPVMSYGAKGLISVVANIIPGVIHRIAHLCLNGKYAEAAAIHKKYLKLIKAMFCDVNPVPIKYACSRKFGTNSNLRLPLSCLSTELTDKLDRIIDAYNKQ